MEKREISVFISYDPKDKPLRDQLENHLSILKHRGLISTWHEQAVKYDEQYALAFHGMGHALKRLGKVNESERAFEKAKQLGYED